MKVASFSGSASARPRRSRLPKEMTGKSQYLAINLTRQAERGGGSQGRRSQHGTVATGRLAVARVSIDLGQTIFRSATSNERL